MKRIGFGQVEPNHLSAQRNGQIYAQLPAHIKKASGTSVETANTIAKLENGQFAKYDYANGEVNFTGAGEWMLVFNEVKLYDGYRETYKDFALKNSNAVNGEIVPRLFKLSVGDIYTTNCLEKENTDGKAEITMTDVNVGDILTPSATGFLTKVETEDVDDTEYQLQVVKVYTLADGQAAVKLMRIA